MKALIAIAVLTCSATASARELIVEDCGAHLEAELRPADSVVVRCDGLMLLDPKTMVEFREREERYRALEAERTQRGLRLASYAAGFTIGAVGGVFTSSEMTSKPGWVAGGTVIGAVVGTAFVLVVDQLFLK